VTTGPCRDRSASPATAPVGIADLLSRPLPARGALSVWDHGPGGERQACQAWRGRYGHSTLFAESGPEVGIEPAVAAAAVPPRLSSCRSPEPTRVDTGRELLEILPGWPLGDRVLAQRDQCAAAAPATESTSGGVPYRAT
jgi:hypothetical protein